MHNRLLVSVLAVLFVATLAHARARREEHDRAPQPSAPATAWKKTEHAALKAEARKPPRAELNQQRAGATPYRLKTKLPQEGPWFGSEKPSSARLETNLNHVGRPVTSTEAAHHIIAGDDPRATQARQILFRAGIRINDPINGVGLPKNTKVPNPRHEMVHSTLHTDEYYKKVNRLMANAAKRGTVRNTLQDLAWQLEHGGLR